MTNNLREVGDACWTSFRYSDWQRAIGDCQVVPVADDMIYIVTRGVVGNVTAVRTAGGLVVFDSGSVLTARKIYDALRAWDPSPVHTIVLTHGHVDHALGVRLFDVEARLRGEPPVRVIGQRNMAARFDRYRATAGFNANIMVASSASRTSSGRSSTGIQISPTTTRSRSLSVALPSSCITAWRRPTTTPGPGSPTARRL